MAKEIIRGGFRQRRRGGLSDDRALPNGRIWGRVKRPVILLTGQMSIMVAGKRVAVPPLWLSVQEEEERRRLSGITQAC